MSKDKKKKVVTTNDAKATVRKTGNVERKSRKRNVTPTTSRRSTAGSTARMLPKEELIYKRENYFMMLGGVVLIALGMLLMTGGAMPDNDTWDPNIIYSARRTVLAPICILAGLTVEIFAIFKKF